MRRTILLSCLLVPLLGLSACSGGDPKELSDQASSALATGDDRRALEGFEKALASLMPGDPAWLRASLGRCQALARLDPPAAKKAFLELARAHSAKVEVVDFGMIVGELVRKGAMIEAIDVMDAGIKLYPESPEMTSIRAQVMEASSKTQDPAAMQKLKGLGYVGDD
jgi:hypothetical protein